jgi:hypothetical protein
MRPFITCFVAMVLASPAAAVRSADETRAYILNEDSHPHQVAPGDAARFSLQPVKLLARMDVKCSLQAEAGKPFTAVTLRTHGLTGVHWPFPTRTIRVEHKIDFDIVAEVQSGTSAYYEFVNEDSTQLLWHQCYNN